MPSRRSDLTLPPTLVWLPLASLLLGASCSGAQGETSGDDDGRHRGPRVENLEQVDLSELSRPQRRVWVELINDLLSPCGEPVSVCRCVSEQRRCRQCVPAARYLSRLIVEGYERQQVEELYARRYDPDEAVEVNLEGAPSRGSPMAPVTIIEFSDFECPYCGQAHPVLAQILNEFQGRVRVVFKHFPLSTHPRAMPAARAAIAAGNQGKFWEMHDLLFEHQTQLTDEDLERYAEELGLDVERFRSDLASTEVQRRIEADKQEGQRVGIDSTPSFLVNGRRFEEPPSALAAYIREELDR